MISTAIQSRFLLLLLTTLISPLTTAADEGDRFVKAYHISTNLCVVISEGDMEWRSIGSYTIRLHEWADDAKEPAGEFYSGLVRPRDGTIESVLLIDVDGEGKKDVVVMIRCVGTGSYLSADAFAIHGTDLVLLAHVEDLLPKANVITALKDQIRNQKKK